MFGSACGQAEGLRQWFRPAPDGRLEVVSLDADDLAVELAGGLDELARSLRLRLAWQDPGGLLPAGRAWPGVPADLLVSLSRERLAVTDAGLRCLGALVIARPRAEHLPGIYAAIKTALAGDAHTPVTIVWHGYGDALARYEENLRRTAHRFLGVSLEFLPGSQALLEACRASVTGSVPLPGCLRPLVDVFRSRPGLPATLAPVVHD